MNTYGTKCLQFCLGEGLKGGGGDGGGRRALIQSWELVNFCGLQDGCLLEVGSYLRWDTSLNKLGNSFETQVSLKLRYTKL